MFHAGTHRGSDVVRDIRRGQAVHLAGGFGEAVGAVHVRFLEAEPPAEDYSEESNGEAERYVGLEESRSGKLRIFFFFLNFR